MGTKHPVVIDIKLIKELDNYIEYGNDLMRIRFTLAEPGKYVVKLITKDDFTGETAEALFLLTHRRPRLSG